MTRHLFRSRLAAPAVSLVLLFTSAPPSLDAQTVAPPARPAAAHAGDVAVVPDRFLRRFDPITLFFPADLGPPAGGPEDHPERVARLEPAHAGAFTWLDARTLQFQPADPWPPLERFTVIAGGRSVRLATLLSPPVETAPRDGAAGLDPVEELSLQFREPLPVEALVRAVVVELRPLPGLEGAAGRFLTPQDFEVKTIERRNAGDLATYLLRFKQPLASGQRVFVRFRLTLEDEPGRTFAEISFSTAEPFRVVRFGCAKTQLAVSPDGARHAADEALACDADSPAVVVDFSSPPAAFDPVAGRNLVRIAPSVSNLAYELAGRRLVVRGDFARDTAYRVTLAPSPLADSAGRALELRAANELTLSFPRQRAYLALGAASGLVERFGPQMVPVSGRGEERVDLRVVRVPPLERSLWPFDQAVTVKEDERPPGPGERPAAFTDPLSTPALAELAQQISALQPAPASALVDLPLRRTGGAASFGLDLRDALARLGGAQAPGTYLVGLRRLGSTSERTWMRVQSTDLALSTLEEPRRVMFVVTSLSTAQPVAGASVVVEGSFDPADDTLAASWIELYRGTTDASGQAAWEAEGSRADGTERVRRIRVERGDDTLVLDPWQVGDAYADNAWHATGEGWLQWTQEELEDRGAQPEELVHVFTERPVYRPEEPVHIKAYLRHREGGHLEPIDSSAVLVVEGPGDLEWRYPVEPSENGSIYWKFDETEVPTGAYRVRVELLDPERRLEGGASFRKEAYRLPRFEVRLDGPERAALDREFAIQLTATYYAGGRVAARPVAWRVTQFPYDWSPRGRPGFLFSSDARFSRSQRFESTAAIERADSTDEDGGARLVLNPAIEPTAQPRTYVVEATVTGADDQTVTATRQVAALPPLLVGLKVPRFVERPGTLRPEVLVLGPDDAALAGQSVTVRLLQRQWHSHLRASDFTDGVARYVTDVVDKQVLERQITSSAGPVAVELPIATAGVYVVELEAHDTLDRAQVVSVDLFAGGDDAVAWPKPATAVFAVAPDKARYDPGETARLLLQSPFQTGEALVVVEAPDGNRYSWLAVRGGKAVFELPIDGFFTPRVPVHFVLMRGRLEGTAPLPGNATDLGRPAAFAATAWLDVEPVAHRLDVTLAYPKRAQPGQEITVGIELEDPAGAPLPGEVTLWLVDQAVLALGRRSGSTRCRLPHGGAFPSLDPRHAQPGLRHAAVRAEARRRRRGRGGEPARPPDHAQELQARAVLRPGDRGRPRRQGERAGQALRRPHQLQAARQGGQRPGALRLRDRQARGAPAGRSAAGAAALRAAGRPLPGRRDRARRRGRGRRGHGASPRRGRDARGGRRAVTRLDAQSRHPAVVPGRRADAGRGDRRQARTQRGRAAHRRAARGGRRRRRLRGALADARRPRARGAARARDARGRQTARAPATARSGAAGVAPAPAPGLGSAGSARARRGPRLPARLSLRLHRAAAVDDARPARAAPAPRRAAPRGG